MKLDLHFLLDPLVVINSAPDAVVIINQHGTIVHINAQTESMFAYAREELIGDAVEQLMPERYRDRHVSNRNHYIESPRIRPMGAGLSSLYGLKKTGEEFPIEISLSPLRSNNETLTLATIRDATEHRRFERTLQEKNTELEKAIQAKDNFLASMSHELRTPLNAIIGFTGTLLMQLPGPLNQEQSKQLSTISQSAKHLLSLINDLLDLAKIKSGKVEIHLEAINCQTIIDDIVTTLRPLAKQKNITITTDMPETIIYAKADQRALKQIIINLTNNAIKFTDQGSVTISLREAKIDGHACCQISVADTGIGISQDNQRKIFEAFKQVHHKPYVEGTGLGLHLSQKLALLLNGNIQCASTLGQGSCFILTVLKWI